ncbi:MAG TPA: WHG domain-containing protein [Vicinamibacterales bacterium]|nr:WHG domain-containing protein [Vicinamibacterales bacterium]
MTNRLAGRKLSRPHDESLNVTGVSNVTVRRLSDEIAYSQPVLYAHFGSRQAILDAVAIEGFQEIGPVLEKARKRVRRGSQVEAVATAYLEFAASSPALYEAMFSLGLTVPFDHSATPPELHFAFSQLLVLFQGQGSRPEVLSEVFWAGLHGIAELTRTKRFPPSRQKELSGRSSSSSRSRRERHSRSSVLPNGFSREKLDSITARAAGEFSDRVARA